MSGGAFITDRKGLKPWQRYRLRFVLARICTPAWACRLHPGPRQPRCSTGWPPRPAYWLARRNPAQRLVRLLKQMSYRDPHAHCFWLEVKALNTRALKLYASEGFVEEGRLRVSVRVSESGAQGYDSLIVMSMLDREYQARRALGLEGTF